MVICNSNKLHSGLKILFENEPYAIECSEFVKPGKGQAFVRIKMRRLLTGNLIEKVFKAHESIKLADILDITLKYLYFDNIYYYFMHPKSFEQYAFSKVLIKDVKKWLLNDVEYIVTLWNKKPIQIVPPNFIQLKVVETQISIKGDTAVNTGQKLATLSTGAIIKVPLFIQTGEKIKIDTRSGSYVARVKI